jgi:hypothetical protein
MLSVREVRSALLRGISTVPVDVSVDEIEALHGVVDKNRPADPFHYAFVVGRNWAVSKRRKEDRAARRHQAELLAAEEARLRKEAHERAVAEFENIVADLWPVATEVQRCSIKLVKLSAVDGCGDDKCYERFPDTTTNQRYQWKRRGIKLVWPHASLELRQLIGRRCKQ